MSEVPLDRAEGAARPAARKDLRQTGDFDRIAQRGRSAVAFNIAHLVGCDPGITMRGADGIGLPRNRGRGEGHLVRAVVVGTDAPDHRVDLIPCVERIR